MLKVFFSLFLNFKMKVPHNISDNSKLSFAEVCCYREDEHGRKTVEKVPNRATVLFNNPGVRLNNLLMSFYLRYLY